MKMISRLDGIEEFKPIFQLYLAHMSQFFEIRHFDAWCEGAMNKLPLYLETDDRHIYILKMLNNIIGFSLINQHLRFNTDGFAIADFFVQKEYEGAGYGRQLAEHVFSRFPGNWEVAVSRKNKNALSFWNRVVSSYTNGNFIREQKTSFRGYGILFNNQKSNSHGL